MIVFEGQAALSSFRLAALAARVGSLAPGLGPVSTRWLYFIELEPGAVLGEADSLRLGRILEARPGGAATSIQPLQLRTDTEKPATATPNLTP